LFRRDVIVDVEFLGNVGIFVTEGGLPANRWYDFIIVLVKVQFLYNRIRRRPYHLGRRTHTHAPLLFPLSTERHVCDDDEKDEQGRRAE
jgi:hypothetical protein